MADSPELCPVAFAVLWPDRDGGASSDWLNQPHDWRLIDEKPGHMSNDPVSGLPRYFEPCRRFYCTRCRTVVTDEVKANVPWNKSEPRLSCGCIVSMTNSPPAIFAVAFLCDKGHKQGDTVRDEEVVASG